MKRRSFTKKSAAISAGLTVGTGFLTCTPKMARKNWAGNLTYRAKHLKAPDNTSDLSELMSQSKGLRALGTAHSFNDIADHETTQVSLTGWQSEPVLDKDQMLVTIDANMRYGELAIWLHERGYAVHNLASLPHISVAGACATATHGSGDQNGNLATAVRALEITRANGQVDRLDDTNQDALHSTIVGLGALGVITKMSLAVVPTFEIRQDLFLDLPLENLPEHFDQITSSGYSVSFFTDWQQNHINQIWVKSKIQSGKVFESKGELFGAQPADRKLHPIMAIDPVHCTEQMGQSGPWHQRLPHFKLEFTPSSGEELQSEYFVPRRHAVDAILAVQKLGSQVGPHILISEIRTIAADELWMSPCYQEPCVAIHFTWKPHGPEVSKLLSIIESELIPFAVRPHWGKLFNLSAEHLERVYTRLSDFRKLVEEHDPGGKLRNRFIRKHIFGQG